MAQPGSEYIVKITSEVVFQDDGTTAYRTKVMGELVRCKDCYWYESGFTTDEDAEPIWEWCSMHKMDTQGCRFCDWGTRKDGAE